MEHNAHAETSTVEHNGRTYTVTKAVCACGWSYPGGAASDRIAHAHNATEAANAVDTNA